jgi:leader peptidase (prepilin peptidase)/N-methyltransferase
LRRARADNSFEMLALLVLAVTGGLVVGSFLNVVIYRLPRGESLVAPRSRCPGCGHPVRPRDNVPVLSWLLLRGRCRDCAKPIPSRYPLVEALTATLYVVVVLVRSDAASLALGLVLVTVAVPAAAIDLEHRIIPNRLLLAGTVAALACGLALDPAGEPARLLAAAGAGGFLLIAVLAYPRGMGMGDVKFAAFIGLCLGRAVAPAMLAALIAGVIVGALVIARAGVATGRKTAIPFGPSLALGAVLGIVAGGAILDWYMSTFA